MAGPNSINKTGTHAARPAAGTAGLFYRETDTGSLFYDDGAAWQSVGGGGSGAMTHIAEQIVTSSVAASITFAAIPGTYRHLLLVCLARGDTAAQYTNILAQFNGDTGGNYDWSDAQIYNGASAGHVGAAATSLALGTGSLMAASAPANWATPVRLTVHDYARAVWYKTTESQYLYNGNGTWTLDNVMPCIGNGMWLSTAAVTDILLKPAAGNFAVGSVFTLFGIL